MENPVRVVVSVVGLLVLLGGARGVLSAAGQDQAKRSVRDGVFTPEQAAQGRQQFQMVCASCHSVGEHTGNRFVTRWQGTTLGDLFDLVSNTMPESAPGSLKPEEYASLFAYFLSESGYKSGDSALPGDVETLKKIQIDPPK